MIGLSFTRRGLAPVMVRAEKHGFAALVLQGRDVPALIAEEYKAKVLAQAIEHARRHNELRWMEACARRLGEVDASTAGQLKLAAVLAKLGKLAEAEALLVSLPAAARLDEPYVETLGVLRAKQGLTEEALACFDRLPGGVKAYHPAAIVLPTAEDMIQDSPIASSLPFMSRLHELYPDHMLIRSLLVRCLAYDGRQDEARELAAVPQDVLAKAPSYERRRLREATALIAALAGWNNELFEFARDALAEDPTHWAMYYLAGEAAAIGCRNGEYDEIVGRLGSEQGKTPEALAILCRWMIDKERIAEAKGLIEELRQVSASSFLGANLYLAIHEGAPETVGRAFERCWACGIEPIGPVIARCMYLYYFGDHRLGFASALDLFERHRSSAENNPHFWQTYLRCLIAADRMDEAKSLYLSRAPGVRNAAKLKPFGIYFDLEQGGDAAAEDAWARFIRTSKHACVNARTSYPETVALRYVERPGDVLLFATVYNGMPYIDWFLAHYRALGVDHFFITDNVSDDGTAERLAREPDVSLFSNRASFAGSGFGVVWTNHQMQRFGVGRWCFHVDVDEGFVFPGHESGRSLKDLISYLDDRAYGAMAAVELDMYPERLVGVPASDLFAAHCHFDSDYQTVRCEIPPYRLIQGGIRRRMTGLALTMTKTPLVRVSPDFRYLECNHYTTHLPVADVTGALLHYKFVGDVAQRLDEAIGRGEHFGGALAYRRLRSAAGERGWEASLLSEFSHRYQGAGSLEAAGVIHSSTGWEAFRPPG